MERDNSQNDKLPYPSRIDLLELDIDTRLADLWAQACEEKDWDLYKVAAYMRAAYGRGYVDVLQELPQDKGSLVIDHGYRMPQPRPLPLDRDL